MRLSLALCGVLLVVLAVSSSLGLLSYLGLPANLLVIRVMPLLALAVGLDNLFFLVHSYEVRVPCSQSPLLFLHTGPCIFFQRAKKKRQWRLGMRLRCVCLIPSLHCFFLYVGMFVFFQHAKKLEMVTGNETKVCVFVGVV